MTEKVLLHLERDEILVIYPTVKTLKKVNETRKKNDNAWKCICISFHSKSDIFLESKTHVHKKVLRNQSMLPPFRAAFTVVSFLNI